LVTNPLIIAEIFKMQVLWFILFTIVIRISPNNTCLLFQNKFYIKEKIVK